MPTLQLPSIESLDAAASNLSVTATPAEARKLIAAQCALHEGLVIVSVPGAFLVRSFTSGTVYRVSHTDGCNCPARVKPCKHMVALQIVEEAQSRPTMPNLSDRLAARRKALMEINELF
jgi:hypothetical protein